MPTTDTSHPSAGPKGAHDAAEARCDIVRPGVLTSLGGAVLDPLGAGPVVSEGIAAIQTAGEHRSTAFEGVKMADKHGWCIERSERKPRETRNTTQTHEMSLSSIDGIAPDERDETTAITGIRKSTRAFLYDAKMQGETYDDLFNRLLDSAGYDSVDDGD